jgi:RNA polymerase sigma-70 factor (ECF subfamily)
MPDRAAQFNQHRGRLYGIAYRMLGSRAEAEDMVQDAYLRWHKASAERITTPEAWLVTTLTRLCIDRLRAVRTEREAYIGPWLPEPVIPEAAPADAQAELASDLSIAFLALLERLAPEERAAFLLHEVFDSDYSDVARILGKSQSACRQILHRARKRVRENRPRFEVSDLARQRLLERFVAALEARDQNALLALFAKDATWTSDGGGKAKAARKIVRGGARVSRFASGVWHKYMKHLTHRLVTLNGEPGLAMFVAGRLVSVISIETDGVHILDAFSILNPDKLKGLVALEARA